MTTLYRRLLGARFEMLPSPVRALHDVAGTVTWTGRADVERGASWPARVIATAFGLPPAGLDQHLTVTFTPQGDAEVWTRAFGHRRFVSTQRARGNQLREAVGPVTLHMTLQADDQGLSLTLVAASFLGLPVPNVLLPRIRTRENGREDRYHFDVEAVVPAFGLLVRYRGWLVRAAT